MPLTYSTYPPLLFFYCLRQHYNHDPPSSPTHTYTHQGDPDVPLPSPYAHGIMVVGNVQWPGLHKTLGRPVDPNYAYGALPPPFPIVDTPRDPALMAVPGNRLGPGQRHPTPGAFPSQNDAGEEGAGGGGVGPASQENDIMDGIAVGPRASQVASSAATR